MTEEQIGFMVNRFLGWKLPSNFNPDAGISFKAAFNEHTAHPMKHEPSGTNLFDAGQADAMVRYMLEGMPSLDIRPSTSAMHDLISAIIQDEAQYDPETNTWDTSNAATAIIAAFDNA